MRLYYSASSPFAAKVRMAAGHCDIALDSIAVDTSKEPEALLNANPLGKIPVLVLDDGSTVFDSAVICDYLDRKSGNQLLPQTDSEWLHAKVVEATADGVVDAAILIVYEGRYRPEEKRHEPWVDMQFRKVWRGMAQLEKTVDSLPSELTVGHFAVAALLGYFDLRFKGQWEEKHPKLVRWLSDFATRFPAFEELKPRAA